MVMIKNGLINNNNMIQYVLKNTTIILDTMIIMK